MGALVWRRGTLFSRRGIMAPFCVVVRMEGRRAVTKPNLEHLQETSKILLSIFLFS
jgi:hypothetical protein